MCWRIRQTSKLALSNSREGFSLVEVMVAIGILSVTVLIMSQRFTQLLQAGKIDSAAYVIAKHDRAVRLTLTNFGQTIQRVATERNCTNFVIDTTNQITPSSSSELFTNPQIGAAEQAWQRCSNQFISSTSDLTNQDSFHYCYKGYRDSYLVEAKMVFWDYARNQPINCDQMSGNPNRGLQIIYSVYAVVPTRGPRKFSAQQFSGQIMAPKAVFKANKVTTDVSEVE